MVINVFKENAVIYIDSREKNNFKIINYLNENGIEWKCKKLEFGDYSLEYRGQSYENGICIERKGSLDELAGNLTKGRERFAREFERAQKEKCCVYLMVEGGSWEQIAEHKYRSMFPPNAYKNSLITWQNKFMFQVDFVKRVKSGEYIVNKFMEFASLLF